MHDAPASARFPETLDAATLRAWLIEYVCPYWADRVVDPKGGFFESLDAQGVAVKSSRRTVMVLGRLTYVFSHATVLDPTGLMKTVAAHGFEELSRWEHECGTVGGWARARLVGGGIEDATRDTYDQAFVILACAWYHAATGSSAAVAMAQRAYGFFEAHVRDAVHGGFFEEFPDTRKLPRRQNPHMHLLEACLAMYRATCDATWLSRCDGLLSLFRSCLFDPASGTIAEFYAGDWTLVAGPQGQIREPGHQFEWVWLLAEYRRLGGTQETADLQEKLFAFGRRYGIDGAEPRMVFDAIDPAGAVIANTKLFWPQTEYIKACVVRAESGDNFAASEIDLHLRKLKQHFFRADGANWCNHISRSGTFMVNETPARVLYHLFLAVAEMVRYKDLLAARPELAQAARTGDAA